jgi:hypothetical protein
MTKTLTLNDVLEFAKWVQHNEEAKQCFKDGNLLDLVMMNGKRLRDCTGLELGEEAERMKRISEIADKIDKITLASSRR